MAALTYSIILPAYNESTGIADTLNKILAYVAKHSSNAEIIVVDGGSSDGTREIVREYAGKHQAMRLLASHPVARAEGERRPR